MITLDSIGCLYLHGFLSSPQSLKAQETLAYFRQQGLEASLRLPELHFAPAEAIAQAADQLQQLQQRHEHVFVIGSSLGGFYATWLAQNYQIPAILVNPAVRPHQLFRHYLGPHQHYHSGETFEVTESYLQQLVALEVTEIAYPEDMLLLLQTADETLDYRYAADLYRACPGWNQAGGSHGFDSYQQFLPRIMAFVSHRFRLR
ncbi:MULTISPECIES: YqiA/YcfP family alpha/beta fold hydrolase [unclassified Oceanobacter]|uniref:YqiA/YcfP family alpha/beta fold hydrolase n=1 Tax=unclassified Oceanobacter TaxID=2620260 RepID=UPI0026E474DA|nr:MULTISPECIES: YqiA/YcfP family alpha/beta fold hydrolase [unclassified Oceanobacter]MDO6680914.1 YqiA/YcfP family alpha/beta fold hydrolase [Oceanobacter sp. 5_MG-2023]MDP2504675.1 YqiA/YcfP family alpha/beta fold hydrolase [Oceanobacter sp. 3_MG-2023]